MAKRFIDTELWDKEKFNNASPKLKLLSLFIFCKCDCIGIFKVAKQLINVYVGSKITDKDILSIPMDIEKLKDGSFWLSKFCSFQYGELTETCKPHKKYIEMLKSKHLFERVLKGYTKGIDTLQETETETEEDKEEEKEEEGQKKPAVPDKNIIPPTAEMVEKYISETKYKINAEKFINYYTTIDWVVGKKKMKDWQAAVRNWFGNDFGNDSAEDQARSQKPEATDFTPY